MNYRVIRNYAIMSTPFLAAANRWGVITGSSSNSVGHTQTHTQVVISRSLGVLLDKEAAVAIPLAAASPTLGRYSGFEGRRGEKPRDKKGPESKADRSINLTNKRTCDTHFWLVYLPHKIICRQDNNKLDVSSDFHHVSCFHCWPQTAGSANLWIYAIRYKLYLTC